jgi:LysR family transcriptional activator of nhaA
MSELNYRHLRYFWMVAKTGSIVRASEQLHLTPQSISGQLSEFENKLGVDLFRRAGRALELTDAGRRILGMAEEIFAIGDQLLEVLHDNAPRSPVPFRLGLADSVSKSMVYRLVEPALRLGDTVRLVCHDGHLTALLADLAIHRLDMIIADRPMPANLNVRGFSHLLGESSITVFAAERYAQELSGTFPRNLNGARVLMPGEDVAIRPKLIQWFDGFDLRPRIIGEFDDSALIKAFGQAGAGLFFAPTAIADHICGQYKVVQVGHIDSVIEQHFAITTERHLAHPAVAEISKSAREVVFTNRKPC